MSGEGLVRAYGLGVHRQARSTLVTCLVDANVLCEATRPDPVPSVVEWLTRNRRDFEACGVELVDPFV